MKILIKNGSVVDTSVQKKDILIENNTIVEIADSINEKADRVIDASGKHIFYGFCDTHVHLRDPGLEYKEDISSGVRAGAKGGFTYLCCMPNTQPVNDCVPVTEYIINHSIKEGFSEVLPIASITKNLEGKQLTEMAKLKKAGAIAFSDDGCPVTSGNIMRLGLEYAKSEDMLLMSHCEDKTLSGDGVVNEGYNSTLAGLKGINRSAEESMIARECILAESLNTKVHICHVSTHLGVALIRFFKSRGVRVTAETCPHYFSLTDDVITSYDTYTKVNPPLRTQKDRQAIIEGLVDGTLDNIATDHAPHSFDDKNVEYDRASFGISGLETCFSLAVTNLYKTGKITLPKLNELLSYSPRKIIGKEGFLRVGNRADIVIADLDKSYVVDSSKFVSKGKNTPFNNMTLSGVVEYNIINGKIKLDNGVLVEE